MPPLPRPSALQALTHFVSTDTPNRDTETQRVTQGRVEVAVPVQGATRHTVPGCPEGEASLWAVGVGCSMAGREASAVCVPPPHPHPALAGKMPALCSSHGPLCGRQHPGGG